MAKLFGGRGDCSSVGNHSRKSRWSQNSGTSFLRSNKRKETKNAIRDIEIPRVIDDDHKAYLKLQQYQGNQYQQHHHHAHQEDDYLDFSIEYGSIMMNNDATTVNKNEVTSSNGYYNNNNNRMASQGHESYESICSFYDDAPHHNNHQERRYSAPSTPFWQKKLQNRQRHDINTNNNAGTTTRRTQSMDMTRSTSKRKRTSIQRRSLDMVKSFFASPAKFTKGDKKYNSNNNENYDDNASMEEMPPPPPPPPAQLRYNESDYDNYYNHNNNDHADTNYYLGIAATNNRDDNYGRRPELECEPTDDNSTTSQSTAVSSFWNFLGSNKTNSDNYDDSLNAERTSHGSTFWAMFGYKEEPKEDLRKKLLPTPSAQALLEAMEQENPINIFFLAKTTPFYKACEWAFELMDTDRSGDIDENELYTGLLLIHLKLGSYVGPAACRYVTREEAHDVFRKFDVDRNGALDREEFRKVMMVLFSKVLLRVTVQFCLTLIIVPMITKLCLDITVWLTYQLWQWISSWLSFKLHFLIVLVEPCLGFGRGETLYLEEAIFIDWNITSHPSVLRTLIYRFVQTVYRFVPEAFLTSLPLAFVSAILGMMIVPNILIKVDDYVQRRAIKKQTSLTNSKGKKISSRTRKSVRR